jgi:hypothetical protein
MGNLEDLQLAMLTACTPAELFEAEAKAKAHLEAHPDDRDALACGFERLAMIRIREVGKE